MATFWRNYRGLPNFAQFRLSYNLTIQYINKGEETGAKISVFHNTVVQSILGGRKQHIKNKCAHFICLQFFVVTSDNFALHLKLVGNSHIVIGIRDCWCPIKCNACTGSWPYGMIHHPSTDCAQCCLTSVIEGTAASNIAYGR
jgi:hypothetical protein